MATKWAFFKRYDIPDILDPTKIYLTRWRILQTPWFGLFLHAIRMPDVDRHLHDHPWSFLSLILKGGYVEKRPYVGYFDKYLLKYDKCNRFTYNTRVAGSIAYRKAEHFHSVASLKNDAPVWTLVFIGRNRRKWGYMTENGWVDHNTYHKERMYDVSYEED